MIRAPWLSNPGVEQPQVVIDLGHRPDRRARVMRRCFLLDTDRGRQTFDEIHIRFFHQRQELPSVGRERFHVTALALGIDRVKGKGGLPGPGKPRDHNQLVARQVDVDTLQVVGPGPANLDLAHGCWVAKKQTVNITSLVTLRSKSFHVLLSADPQSVPHRKLTGD